MAIYRVEAPDKSIIEFEGPDNASQNDILGFAKHVYLGGLAKPTEPEKSFATQMYEAGKRGVASTVNAAELFGAETPEEISNLVAENVKAQPAPTAIQKKMAEEIKPYEQEYAESSGIGAVLPALSMTGKRAMQFAQNPKEFALSTAENLPNSVPGIAGGLLGKIGRAHV